MQTGDAIRDYINYIVHEMGVADSTHEGYKCNLRAYARFVGDGDYDKGAAMEVVEALATANLRRWLYYRSENGARPRTVRGLFFPLRGMAKFLREHGILKDDPLKGITLPKLDDPIRHTVSDQECGLLLAACDRVRDKRRGAMARGLLHCLIFCGVRAQELLDIKIPDVSLERGTLQIVHGKGGKSRTLYPTTDTFDAIKGWLALRASGKKSIENDWLWAFDTRRRIGYSGLTALLDEIKHIAGLADHDNVHCHALRRGFATRLMQAGASIKSIQAALGHSDPQVTFVYLADTNEPARAMQVLARLNASSGSLLPSDAAKATAPISTPAQAAKPTRADHMMRRRLPVGRGTR